MRINASFYLRMYSQLLKLDASGRNKKWTFKNVITRKTENKLPKEFAWSAGVRILRKEDQPT